MVGVELADLAVQGSELLALGGPADDDLAALHIAVVKGVHGLAIFQHNIVCDVHDVVDGPDSHGAQPLPHPLGGGGDLHVADHPGGVPGAQLRIRGLYIQKVTENALGAALHHRLVETQLRVEGGGGLTGQTNHAETVGTIGGDLKFHHVVVGVNDGLDVIAGLYALLVEDEDTVRDAVGELRLLGVEVLQGADGAGFGVEGNQVPGVEVGTGGGDDSTGGAVLLGVGESAGPSALSGLYRLHPGGHYGAVDLVPRLDVGRDGRLVLVQRLVVAQNGGRGDNGIGEVTLVQPQLIETAEHTVGEDAPELALLNFLAAGQGGLVEGHRNHIALVDVPGAGDDLHGLILAHIDLADPHVVTVGVALQRQHLACHYVGDLRPQVLSSLHFGAGEGHCLRKILIVGVYRDKFIEPFSA